MINLAYLKHFQKVLFLHLQPDKRLLLFHDRLEESLEVAKVVWRHLLTFEEHVVVVTTLNGRAVAETATIVPLHGLTKDVGARVPEYLFAYILSHRYKHR